MMEMKIADNEDKIRQIVSVLLHVVCLEEALYNSPKGVVYKSILEAVEKPLIEQILKRTEGNQLKAARILGVNRNTMRSKIRKLGIDARQFKQR